MNLNQNFSASNPQDTSRGGMFGSDMSNFSGTPEVLLTMPNNESHTTSTPISPEGGMPIPTFPSNNAGQIPSLPIAPDGGMPIPPMPPMNIPTPPIAPEGSMPIPPIQNIPSLPIAPGGGVPAAPGRPNIPSIPSVIVPVPNGACNVRFLHAATNSVPYGISIGSRTITNALRYSEATPYASVMDGFRTVTVMSARSPRSILLRKNIAFRAGTALTLSIVNTRSGIDIIEVSDTLCSGISCNLACLRMVNASFNSTPMDLILYDGRVVFADIRYKEASSIRRVRPGEYGFYVTSTPYSLDVLSENMDIETMEAMPISISENYIPGYGDLNPLVSFYETFRACTLYTTYVIGLGTSSYPFTVVILQTR